jgi:CRP-like cAMP-binding protein
MTAISGILANIPILSQLPASELDAVGQVCERVSFKPGEQIVHEGGFADAAYYLISGEVDSLSKGLDGRVAPVRIPHGATLLELAMIIETGIHATCMARSTVRMLRIPRNGIHALLEETPALADMMAKTLTARLVEMAETMRAASQPFDELERSA